MGYSNSNVPLTIKLHCFEEVPDTGLEGVYSSTALDNFARSKSSAAKVRGSADVAVLFVAAFSNNVCGVAYQNSVLSGITLSVVRKVCAQGWIFMSCSHCQEWCQQASWLMIGCTKVNDQSEARTVS